MSTSTPRPGQLATHRATFGPCARYAIFAVHTRLGGDPEWFVQDAEAPPDELTGCPAIIRQGNDAALRGAWAALNQPARFPADERVAMEFLGLS